jgi:hypothetical protein
MLGSLSSVLSAQDSVGPAPIVIEVRDQAGGVISGQQVHISVSPNILGANPRTDVDGRIRIELPPGDYELGVASSGFSVMKKHVAVQDATPQFLSVVLNPFSCSNGCPRGVEVAPAEWVVVSPDQRYAVTRHYYFGNSYTTSLEDRKLKTQRDLFTYDRDVLVLWSKDSKAFSVTGYIGGTGYTGSEVSRCNVFSVEEQVPPITVLDLFARQLSEIEREDLEGHLVGRGAEIIALAWADAADLQIQVSNYDDKTHAEFFQTYILPVDFHPKATAPIWPK